MRVACCCLFLLWGEGCSNYVGKQGGSQRVYLHLSKKPLVDREKLPAWAQGNAALFSPRVVQHPVICPSTTVSPGPNRLARGCESPGPNPFEPQMPPSASSSPSGSPQAKQVMLEQSFAELNEKEERMQQELAKKDAGGAAAGPQSGRGHRC